jgi:hypothetical protein
MFWSEKLLALRWTESVVFLIIALQVVIGIYIYTIHVYIKRERERWEIFEERADRSLTGKQTVLQHLSKIPLHGFYKFNLSRILIEFDAGADSCSCGYKFIHIPKTGGETIENLLKIPKNHRLASDRRKSEACWEKSFKFSIIRNPYDRMVSWYFHLRKSLDKSNRYYGIGMSPSGAHQGLFDSHLINGSELFWQTLI